MTFPAIFSAGAALCSPPRGVEAVGAIGNERVGVRREYLAHVARTVEETVASTEGSVLVFLPGVGEIETVRGNLRLGDIPVLTLHGQLSAADWEEIEESLLIADLGLEATDSLMERSSAGSPSSPRPTRPVSARSCARNSSPSLALTWTAR